MSYSIPFAMSGTWWGDGKRWVEAFTGMEPDLLHMLGGIILMTLLSRILRSPRRGWWALLGLELLNELLDLAQIGTADEATIPAATHDIWLTMAIPTLWLLLFGGGFRLFRRRR